MRALASANRLSESLFLNWRSFHNYAPLKRKRRISLSRIRGSHDWYFISPDLLDTPNEMNTAWMASRPPVNLAGFITPRTVIMSRWERRARAYARATAPGYPRIAL